MPRWLNGFDWYGKGWNIQSFFVSQNKQSPQPGPLPFIPATSLTSKLCEFNIDIFEVERHLSTLDLKKDTGDDGVPTRLLRLMSKNISHCVHHLFRLSLKSGELPQDWKQATVIPSTKREITLYRQITVLYPSWAFSRKFLKESSSNTYSAPYTNSRIFRAPVFLLYKIVIKCYLTKNYVLV